MTLILDVREKMGGGGGGGDEGFAISANAAMWIIRTQERVMSYRIHAITILVSV